MQSDETLQCVDTEKQRNVVKMLRRITLADYFTLSLAIFKASFMSCKRGLYRMCSKNTFVVFMDISSKQNIFCKAIVLTESCYNIWFAKNKQP